MCRYLLVCLFLLQSNFHAFSAEGVDVTSRIELLGNPYQEKYRDGQRVYARNIWALRAYQGSLFIGAGNSSNIGPAPNAGPVPLVRFDPVVRSFLWEDRLDEEQIDNFQIHDGQLFVPGHDPTQNWDWGNFYHREKSGHWVKHRNIPGGLHAYGLAWHQGKFFAALGIKDGIAAVSVSDDQGKSWTVVPNGRSRVYSFLQVADKLYATKRFPTQVQWNKLADEERTENVPVYEFVSPNRFVARSDIGAETLFPGVALQPKQPAKIVRPVVVGETSVYLGAYLHNDHQSLPFGVFAATSLEPGKIKVVRLPLPASARPWDLLVHENFLYVLTSRNVGDGVNIVVLRALLDDLANLSEVLEFTAPTFARSFAILGSDFYFGLGCEVEDPKFWKQEELRPETGQILRVRNILKTSRR